MFSAERNGGVPAHQMMTRAAWRRGRTLSSRPAQSEAGGSRIERRRSRETRCSERVANEPRTRPIPRSLNEPDGCKASSLSSTGSPSAAESGFDNMRGVSTCSWISLLCPAAGEAVIAVGGAQRGGLWKRPRAEGAGRKLARRSCAPAGPLARCIAARATAKLVLALSCSQARDPAGTRDPRDLLQRVELSRAFLTSERRPHASPLSPHTCSEYRLRSPSPLLCTPAARETKVDQGIQLYSG